MPPEASIVEHRKVSINTIEVFRLMIEGKRNNLDGNDLRFVFQDRGIVWCVKYSA
jgi:hypothetical protein